jgi:hypothetical protein|tara:strand:- start:7740 stop:8069 length:330 start_codon:yes stop_codon:yes gene_type:complete
MTKIRKIIHKHDKANFVTHNDVMMIGHSHTLLGTLKADYKTLERVFGSPNSDNHWRIQFDSTSLFSQVVICSKDSHYFNTFIKDVKSWIVKGYDHKLMNRVVTEVKKYG